MRFSSNPDPELGDTRTIIKFLLLPRKLNNEWRWLELAEIKQECKEFGYMVHETSVYATYLDWENISWVTP